MSQYLGDFVDELNALMVSTWGLASTSPIYQNVQAARIDWRQLVEDFELNATGGLQLPYIVAQYYPFAAVAGWGVANASYKARVTLYYINTSRNTIATTTSTTGSGASKVVASASNMFVGQSHYIGGQWYRVLSIVSTTVTYDSSFATTSGDTITSLIAKDLLARMEQLRDPLISKTAAFTSFQVLDEAGDQPVIDISESNQANQVLLSAANPLQAGALTFSALVGQTY